MTSFATEYLEMSIVKKWQIFEDIHVYPNLNIQLPGKVVFQYTSTTDSSTQDFETGVLMVQGQPGLHRKTLSEIKIV